jgi:hypothetical protein
MKSRAVFIFLLVLLSGQLFAQVNQLTIEQKKNDFLFIYEMLKENYPYFGLRKRMNNIDWLANKNIYLKQIESTPNDSVFILTFKKNIVNDLHDGHVNFNCTRYGHEGFSKAYEKASAENTHYKTWVDVFQSADTQIDYWATILKKSEQSQKQTTSDQSKSKPFPNYSDTITANGAIAIMTIGSFNSHKIEDDKEKINLFINKITNCDYLIIDIQQNSGGSTEYWKENIVERLVQDTVFFIQYPILKEGAVNRHFYSDFFKDAQPLSKTQTLSNIPEELLEEKYYIKQEIDTISPKNPASFKGKIYLLVSNEVFSSSEGFTQFCKTTGWATIAGERTGGDGIGSDPALLLLPESKIIIGYPSLIGLNHDGSLNAEERTAPDIEITGKTYQERLDKLIEYLSKNKSR